MSNKTELNIPENDDSIIFAEEDVPGYSAEYKEIDEEKWKIAIIDDEQEVHTLTKMVLSGLVFEGKPLEFISAYSGEEARSMIAANPDTAIVLLDVVMEDESAGLKVVKYIRDELKNNMVRIILRTGQPGQAPEEKIILDYDINDYKAKTELTIQRLYTTIIASLRSYRDLTIIEANKKGLEKIIESSATIFELQSMGKFASGVLTQLISILNLNKNALYCQTSSFAATKDNEEFYILAATGDYSKYISQKVKEVVPGSILGELEKVSKEKMSLYSNNRFIGYFQNKLGSENMIYLEGLKSMSDWDKYLIEIYCTNVSIAFDNIYLNKEVENTQKEIIFTLGEITESRSKETGCHVKRVAEYSSLLASKYGLSEKEVEIMRLAAPMHDIGKLVVSDSILTKPGKLTPEEFEIIKTHTTFGYEMLKNSNRAIMKAASIIALQHHEKYNGMGYPNGLKGEEIHIFGRIAAIADVFDALDNDRVYKKAWELDDTLALLKEEKGKHFDPVLIDLFFDNLDDVLRIRTTLAEK